MKNIAAKEIITILLALLFVYTATSKFLDYDKFVFQMRLAPVPLMKFLAPALGWLMPSIEMVLVAGLSTGLFIPRFLLKSLFATVALLLLFQAYITAMLLSGLSLPCTCGGIISTMSWKQHLLFNAIFIVLGMIAIKLEKNTEKSRLKKASGHINDLSRA